MPSPPPKDNSTLSNYHLFRTTHIHLDWTIDWTKQLIHGSATLSIRKTGGEGEGELVLDSSYLDVRGVEVEGEEVKVRMTARWNVGSRELRVVSLGVRAVE